MKRFLLDALKFNPRLFSWLGVPLHVHILSCVLFLGWLGLVNGWTELFIYVLAFLSIIPHEYGHIAVSNFYGLKCRRIQMLPIGGMAMMESMPRIPKQELLIALAGPLASLGLVLVFLPFALLTDWLLFWGLVIVNVMIIFFNLWPILPLDGGRILRASLGFFMDWGKATLIAVRVGQVLSGLIIFFSILSGKIWLPIIMFLMIISAEQELQRESSNVV